MNMSIIFICLILVIYILEDVYEASPRYISYIRNVHRRNKSIRAKLAQRFIDKIIKQQEISTAKKDYKNNVVEYFED